MTTDEYRELLKEILMWIRHLENCNGTFSRVAPGRSHDVCILDVGDGLSGRWEKLKEKIRKAVHSSDSCALLN